jgi:hypothetical protein
MTDINDYPKPPRYEIRRSTDGVDDTFDIYEIATGKYITNITFWGEVDRPEIEERARIKAEFLIVHPELLRAWRRIRRREDRETARSFYGRGRWWRSA